MVNRMTRTRSLAGMATGVALLLAVTGCGGPQKPLPDPDAQANAKVAALKRLADEMAKDPNGLEARGTLEDFRNAPLDPRVNPQQAEELVQVYRQRIQGKYKGVVAQELQGEMGQFLARTKQGK
jgi:hypothetical protein